MLSLDAFKRSRPKQLVAVYVGPDLVEVVRGRRKWRSWDLETVQSTPVGSGESPYDCLQRLNLRVRGGAACACLLILARPYYSFHREYYPVALAAQLEEVLEFDWDDNLFYEGDRTLHFAGQPVAGADRFVVPVFSIRSEIYGKFHQALGAESFGWFTVVPSALAFLHQTAGQQEPSTRVVGTCHGSRTLELHRLLNGSVVDSLLLRGNRRSSRLFLDGLDVLIGAGPEARESVVLYCRDQEPSTGAIEEMGADRSGFVNLSVGEAYLGPWMRGLLDQERIKAFGDDLSLKARQVPKVIYPIIACLVLYTLFASFQIRSHGQLVAQAQSLQQQRRQLEAKWKPIEERRTRMAQLKEDQKSLTEFDSKGYPVLEVLTLLTEVTPSDTWLEFFSINQKELRLRGRSKAAVKYVSELSKVEGFENVSLVSPIRRDPRSDDERFYLRIQLDSEKLKKRLQGIELTTEGEQVETTPAAGSPAEDHGTETDTGGDEEAPGDVNTGEASN